MAKCYLASREKLYIRCVYDILSCSLFFYWTSSGMFVSSSEDKTGILDQIEKKIERATMIPRRHGEV